MLCADHRASQVIVYYTMTELQFNKLQDGIMLATSGIKWIVYHVDVNSFAYKFILQ